MCDMEIKEYLANNNYAVYAQDCLMKVFNTSHQIIDSVYDYDTSMMTITTPENKFTFKWILG